MNHFRSLARITAGLMLVVLAACGGGGGSNPPAPPPDAVVYDGNTNAAIVTAANAAQIIGGVLGGGDTVGIIAGVSAENGNVTRVQNDGLVNLARRLGRTVRDTADRAGRASSTPRPLAGLIQIDQTDVCENGTVRIVGTLSDSGTGTLQVTFNLCMTDGVTLSGSATLSVDAAVVTLSVVPTDSTLRFTRLTIRGPSTSIDATGSIRVETPTSINETITVFLVSQDNNRMNKKTKTDDLKFVNVYSSSTYTSTVSGKVFDHDHGFVDVSTNAPLFFSTLTQLFPGSGQIVLTGASNARIRATALSPALTKLELDLNGDSAYENAATLRWTDLGGPVGADLGDADSDGMHNNWEIANGLNPNNSADALLDSDNDGFNNLIEYLAGTNPNNSSSVPPTAGLAISMSAMPDPVNMGGNLSFTITVTNTSSTEAVGVVVTDTLPSGVSLGTVTTTQGSCTGTTTSVTCSLGTVLGLNFASITINVTPNVAGALNNSVSVTSSTPDPDLTDNSTATSTMVLQTITGTVVNLPGNSDLIYDATSQMIYAAVLGNPGAVVPVNPLTATLGTSISVGHDPVKLARSGDGQFLYVGLDGTNDVQRIALATQTVNLTFTLGSASLGQNFVEDMEVLPGAPQSVAVSRRYKGFSPRHTGVAIYDDGVPRPNATQVHTGSNVIEFAASAGTLYGYNNETTEFGFRRMTVDGSGVTVLDVFDSFNPLGALISGFGVDIKFHAGLIYTTTGRVINPDTRTIVGTFPLAPNAFGNLVAVDSTVGRAFFLTGDSLPGTGLLRAFDLTNQQLVGSVIVQGMTGSPSSLIRWGAKGLAFRTSDGKVFLIESTILIP